MRNPRVFICFLFFWSHLSFAEETCAYKVKEGDWVAKILRSLGSKDPFGDKSYFKTVKLNQKSKANIHKLNKGDEILIPVSNLSKESKDKLCNPGSKARVNKKVVKAKEETRTYRVPASFKPQKTEVKKEVEASSTEEDPFPILEYKAKLPAGGAK